MPPFSELEHDVKVAVVVIGAVLTGITTVYLLNQTAVGSSRTATHLTYVWSFVFVS